MNWRDPNTGLVHTVNYSAGTAFTWSTRAREESGNRWMLCGLEIHVSRDGVVDGPKDHKLLIARPFLHTQDTPTCLACVIWTPDTLLADYARVAGYDPAEPVDDDVDVEDDQDPLDRDGKA